jgi:hypothetical protein
MPSRIIAALAPARVASYKSFLKLDTADQIHGAYCWNYELVASIFPLIGAVEALLRDSVHAAFANKMAPPGYQNPGAYPWFDPGMNPHQNLNGESLRQVQKLLFTNLHSSPLVRKVPQPSVDDVVAGLTFGFWATMCKSIKPSEAPQLISRIFPEHPLKNASQWGAPANRASLENHIRVVNQFRNRVAHHEPLFKARKNGAHPSNLTQGLANLRACVDHSLTLSDWLRPSVVHGLRTSHWMKVFIELATVECMQSWAYLGPSAQHRSTRRRSADFAARTDLFS